MKTLTQEQQQLIRMMTQRIINLEYQLENRKQMTQLELNQVKEDYQMDREQMTQIIMYQADLMEYPKKMSNWEDTEPMKIINQITSNQLMTTQYYQSLLTQILMS